LPSFPWVSVSLSSSVRLLTAGMYSYTNLGSRISFILNSEILFVLILVFMRLNRLASSVYTAGFQFSAWRLFYFRMLAQYKAGQHGLFIRLSAASFVEGGTEKFSLRSLNLFSIN
jgi:hypothetical protein